MFVLQELDCLLDPGQLFEDEPPQLLVLVFLPPPHKAEHTDQASHAVQTERGQAEYDKN